MNKTIFIVNPHAARGKCRKHVPEIIKELDKINYEYEIILTNRGKAATRLTKDFIDNGYKRIVAVGGDGTINEVVTGIVESGESDNIELGLIPLGGGNDFVKNFNFGNKISENIDRLQKRNIVQISVYKFNGAYFINSLGLGFDAQVAHNAAKIGILNGFMRYFAALLISFFKYRNYSFKSSNLTGLKDKNFLLISLGNGRYVGGGFHLNPLANPSEDEFDICFVQKLGFFRMLRVLPLAVKGKHLELPEINYSKTAKLIIEFSEKIPAYYDGELIELTDNKLTVEMCQSKINLII